jgi:hypothetical protein
MNQRQKYLGMTVTQLGILAGLVILACFLFCLAGWLFLRNGTRNKTELPNATITPRPTSTLVLTPTLTATLAPSPVPYETLIPNGWVQYSSSLYEIWLPTGYKSFAKPEHLVLGLGTSPIVDLSLRGSYTAKSPNRIYVTVSYEPFTGSSFDEHINQRLTEIGTSLTIGERLKTNINTTPAIRLMFSGRNKNNIETNELTYVVLDGSTVWYVQYTAALTEFFNLLPNFESSAKTFRTGK